MSAMTTAALTEIAVGGARSSIDGLDAARQDLSASRTLAERAQAKADKQRSAAEQQAAQLANAISLSQKTQSQLDDRIDQNLAEAASLATLDDALSKEIAAREAAIAERLRKSQEEAAARAAANPGLSGGGRALSSGRPAILPAAGNLVTVHGITVDASIANALAGLIEAAASSGFALGGNGYRSADQQIAVRQHQLRLEPVRHLAEAGLAVPPTGGPPRHVDARARSGHRLHLQRCADQLLRERLLRLDAFQRPELRLPQPAGRGLALVDERQLTPTASPDRRPSELDADVGTGAVAAARRPDRSLQARQTSGGMMPARISRAKIRQPKQMARTDSSVAATTTRPTSTAASPAAPASHATSAPTVSVAPMPWAKRLGGPGTQRGSTSRRGTTTRVTSRASGLSRGSGQDAEHEAHGQRHEDERPAGHEVGRGLQHHAGGHETGDDLVDRVGEPHHLGQGHGGQARQQILTRQLGIWRCPVASAAWRSP